VSQVPRRFLWIALIASLAVNLFVAGFVVANVINRGWHGHHRPHGGRLALRAGFRALDTETRAMAERAWRAKLPEIRARLDAIRTAHHAFRDALDRSDTDPAGVQAAFQRIHEARGAAQQLIHRTIREIADKMTPAERKKFYKAVFDRRFRRDRRARRGPPPHR
jgi:hypothetical protein